jgi:GNAT superfamily N-acetyltransferase
MIKEAVASPAELVKFGRPIHEPGKNMHAAAAPPPANINHSWTTQSGQLIRIRPISRNDVERVAAYLDGLSVGTRYFRFGRWDTQFSRDDLIRICSPNPAECCRLIAVTEHNGVEVQIASAAFVVGKDRESGELSILVSDQWQGTRVAHRLMSHLIECATEFGLTRMFANVLGTNSRMIRFAHRHGFKPVPGTEEAQIKTLVLEIQ